MRTTITKIDNIKETSLAQLFALWPLDVEVPGSIPSETNVRHELFEINSDLGVPITAAE